MRSPSEVLKRSVNSTATSSSPTMTRGGYNSSSSDSDRLNGAPKGYNKLRRGTRKDSIIDFHEANPSMQEANARLQKLEESVEKIEKLLMQLVSGDSVNGDNGAGDEEEEDDAPPDVRVSVKSPERSVEFVKDS